MVELVVLYRFAASRMLGSSSPDPSTPDSISLAISLLTCRYLAMAGLYRRSQAEAAHCELRAASVRPRERVLLLCSGPFCSNTEGGRRGPQTPQRRARRSRLPDPDRGRRLQKRKLRKQRESGRVGGAWHADRV